jgi:hypothetical protein
VALTSSSEKSGCQISKMRTIRVSEPSCHALPMVQSSGFRVWGLGYSVQNAWLRMLCLCLMVYGVYVYVCMCVCVFVCLCVWCMVPKMFGQWINDSTSPTDDQDLSLARGLAFEGHLMFKRVVKHIHLASLLVLHRIPHPQPAPLHSHKRQMTPGIQKVYML